MNAALKITPFHTEALAASLTQTKDMDELDMLVDRILELKDQHSLAYSDRANAAYSRGAILDMITNKESAIACAPYATAEYCDYIEKLYTAMNAYLRAGDSGSGTYCLKKILSVPALVQRTAAKTDPLAYLTGTDTQLVLPEAYASLIRELEESNPGLSGEHGKQKTS